MARMVGDLHSKLDKFVWGDTFIQYGLPGRVLTVVLRYLYAVLRDVFSGQLTLRAMSLVYTTLLSVVPLIAFSFSILKGLGVHEKLKPQLLLLLEPIGDARIGIVDDLMSLVENVNGKVLLSAGLAFFLYTAISMVQKVEESFNYVWYVAKPRSFARRFMEYVFVLMTGPVVIVIALGMIGPLQDEAIVQFLQKNEIIGPILSATSILMPYLLIIAAFTFLYMFMPNTRVRFRSALVGGIAGGFMWATAGVLFAKFVATSARTEAVYASFAIAITTLIWLYLNWLILLIGSQLAFYFQNPAYMQIGRRDPRLSNSMRERLALNIMFYAGREFRNPQQGVSVRSLSRLLKIPSITLAPIVAGLESSGLLTVTESEELQPGREMARIRLDDILSVVRIEGETGSHHDPIWAPEIDALGGRLDKAVSTTLAGQTLSDLLDTADV